MVLRSHSHAHITGSARTRPHRTCLRTRRSTRSDPIVHNASEHSPPTTGAAILRRTPHPVRHAIEQRARTRAAQRRCTVSY
jgi:hypothetical protein